MPPVVTQLNYLLHILGLRPIALVISEASNFDYPLLHIFIPFDRLVAYLLFHIILLNFMFIVTSCIYL